MKTYVVIPIYILTSKLEELTLETIKSFRDTSDTVIIGLDDASPWDMTAIKDKLDVYIRNENNKGFAGNVNVGFNYVLEKEKKEKKECYIVCSNNDILVYPGWLESFSELIEKFDGGLIGGLGYREKMVEGCPIEDYKINVGSLYGRNEIAVNGRYKDWMFPGGLYMIKASVLRKIGLLDESFEHGGYEDIDLFYRARLEGYKQLITPKVQYWHKEGATRFSEEEIGKQTVAEGKNLAYFINKWKFNPHQHMYRKIFTDEIINY